MTDLVEKCKCLDCRLLRLDHKAVWATRYTNYSSASASSSSSWSAITATIVFSAILGWILIRPLPSPPIKNDHTETEND